MNTPAWLQVLLQDPAITDICINGGHDVFVDRGLGMEPVLLRPDDSHRKDALRAWVLETLSVAGKTWDARHPFVDAVTSSGHRLHVGFPPIARKGLLISLRRLPQPPTGEDRGLRHWAEDRELYAKLVEIIQRGESLIVSGATGSGKTTLINDLLGEAPAHERILALEDTPELAPRHPHFISLNSRPPNADGCGEVTLQTLLKQSLRMRPDRIVLGECRGSEVLELLQALNTGHRGALATLHANSPREALKRIELLCQVAMPGGFSLTALRELLALGIQWVAQVKRMGSQRRITELWKIEGREGDTILMRRAETR